MMRKRNKFSLSNTQHHPMDMGQLIPIHWNMVNPGDSQQQSTSMLIRANPLLAPPMHPVHVRVHHWFVPLRLLWEDFPDFITGGSDGEDDSIPPYKTYAGGATTGSLADHLGVPPGVSNTVFSAYVIRAYQMIWNTFYRDQDLQTEVTVRTDGGEDSATPSTLQNVCWSKDYFTSSRPWTQKGPDVILPLGTSAPVVSNSVPPVFTPQTGNDFGDGTLHFSGTTSRFNPNDAGSAADGNVIFGSESGLQTDLSAATGATVSQLREAFAQQRFAEARAKYGSEYVDYLAYLGVKSSDARLQRPEYLGGGKQTIQFSEVLQTAEGTDPVGTMRGHGIAALRTNRYRRFFEEHGIVLTLMSVVPEPVYTQGLAKKFSLQTREDYWQPEFEQIGQDEILNKEVYLDAADKDGIFGYQNRYDWLRSEASNVHGVFRTTYDHWHLAREFSSEPALNSDFVKCVPSKRIFASESDPALLVVSRHSIQKRSLLSKRK
jgi:hypothetical protein